ncbi:SCO family protein [Luteolibacter luteus]|uniref:SCO family protein n=1 Tax=Luteolibacter luteus TaxID=2728835 RepID=A0A858REE6_9BACT|nr:SCO family protein [Luteolibacter luteus]QJE95112.1 SCO family protein [Luteolibacter luteus]
MKALFLACLLGCPAMAVAEDRPAPVTALPQGSLYGFDSTWTNQEGKKVVWKDSGGKTRIVAFGYASCKGVCPRIIGDMQRIEKELTDAERARCRFMFISLDPEHDKVAELKDLGERHKIDDSHWDLLTGDGEAVLEIAVALGIRYDRLPNGVDFAHSYLITVIDAKGMVRHKWSDPSEGPGPSVEAVRKAGGK